jgi:hypothetical protein
MMKHCLTFIFLLSFGIFQACRTTISPSMDPKAIIASYVDDGHTADFQKLTRLNLALAETGQLADKAFHYTQAGSDGIFAPWAMTVQTGELLSDIYWSMGHIAYAQRMAMETNVLYEGDYDPAMMKRLIETNLIYGDYDVAQKYIDILEQDKTCHKFATTHRRFLNNDEAIEADPILGPKRKCIPEKDFISLVRGIDEDLKDIIRANPSYHNAIEYLGVIYLLDCEMDKFKAMLDEFYGTEALPELPASFAEAACMLSEIDHNYWKEVGVSQRTYNRYREFTKRLGTGLSMDKFNDTFWYYIMRVNNQ